VARMSAPIMAVLHANEVLCLYQLQAFLWDTRGSAPLRPRLGHIEFTEPCDGKRPITRYLKQSCLGQCLLKTHLCLGHRQLWLLCEFLKESVECSKWLMLP
jgi:hypothetical protein